MSAVPLKSRALDTASLVNVTDTGAFFQSDAAFATRMALGALRESDVAFLREHGFWRDANDALAFHHDDYRAAQRLTRAGPLDYLIVVPTLRCNLSCSYCQVSRAPEQAHGFDWTEETASRVVALLDQLETPSIKVEFQGGEPTLRPDLIRRVMDACSRFEQRQFVICTNLHALNEEIWALFDRDDTYISTSLDGTLDAHERQRTQQQTPQFVANLDAVLARYGPGKLSALPTIDAQNPPSIDAIIETYASRGLNSIFLRPINYHGFARKRHASSQALHGDWDAYHQAFVRALIDRNWRDKSRVLEETYFSICLRRIFQPQRDRHVDLRNPNPMAVDYLVIDHDGTLYPTDEARMLSRSGVIDLSLGSVGDNWRGDTWQTLNDNATNQFDHDCVRCAYQPFCGRDVIDDLARYGRIDVKRTQTAFCQRHMALFDFAFSLLFDEAPAVRYSLSRWLRLDGEPHAFAASAP